MLNIIFDCCPGWSTGPPGHGCRTGGTEAARSQLPGPAAGLEQAGRLHHRRSHQRTAPQIPAGGGEGIDTAWL